jgi:hypothetical protein
MSGVIRKIYLGIEKKSVLDSLLINMGRHRTLKGGTRRARFAHLVFILINSIICRTLAILYVPTTLAVTRCPGRV